MVSISQDTATTVIDHIVIHVDSNTEITQLKANLDSLDIPFEPTWGKQAKGFKVANIWIGQQYFEIVDILDSDNLWQPQWSVRHAKGERGVYCIFLKVSQDIHQLYESFRASGVKATQPERTRFKWLFGLLEKKLPWQFILLPKIPGTDIEIGIIQYDDGAEAKYERFMVPNTKDKGILGVCKARIYTNRLTEAQTYLDNINHVVRDTTAIQLANMPNPSPALTLETELEPDRQPLKFNISNVAVVS